MNWPQRCPILIDDKRSGIMANYPTSQ